MLSRTFNGQRWDRQTFVHGSHSKWKDYPTQRYENGKEPRNLRNLFLKLWEHYDGSPGAESHPNNHDLLISYFFLAQNQHLACNTSHKPHHKQWNMPFCSYFTKVEISLMPEVNRHSSHLGWLQAVPLLPCHLAWRRAESLEPQLGESKRAP